MPVPSYYESDIDRARRRSQEMQQEMGGAAQQATGALSAFQALQAKLADDDMAKQRLALEQAREDRIAGFGRGRSPGSGSSGTPSTMKNGKFVPDLSPDAPASGAPMTVQEALQAKLRPPMSTLPEGATGQVADVGDIMQKAGLNQESAAAIPDTGDDVVDAGMASKTPGALPSPDVRAALERVAGSAQGDETMASPEVQMQKAALEKAQAEVPRVEAQAKIAQKKAASGTGAGAGGGKSAKQRLAEAKATEEELKLKAMQEGKPLPGSKAATGKGKADPNVMEQRIKEAEELAQIYESGKLNESGGEMLNPEHHPVLSSMFSSDDRNRARQLATGLALGVPSAFSGSTRLNNTEFLHSLQSIIGSPDTSMSNESKAKMARQLAADLKSMKAEMATSPASTTATSPDTGAQPAQHDPATVSAAATYRKMAPAQQAQVKALIAQGIDRTKAVEQVANGGG